MDLISHYFKNETDHIHQLIPHLKKQGQTTEKIVYSNLFNFKINYDNCEVIIEDQCGLFLASNPLGLQKITINKLLHVCTKKMNEK